MSSNIKRIKIEIDEGSQLLLGALFLSLTEPSNKKARFDGLFIRLNPVKSGTKRR
ncbi:hypothetical protein [Streptococcus sp. DD13]|uniref:hypothetical protein n=1 Tax=Streptococcus sp. DD13 TaxID=1777881 RepID=UPI00079BD293|nr:hypothetical protein [Streptococcus sp. DD13]KXT77710.1 hypothetical protein STRDD13_01390 [Streptococcus sp. DD13]